MDVYETVFKLVWTCKDVYESVAEVYGSVW